MTRQPLRDIRRFLLATALFWTLVVAFSWWWNLRQSDHSLREMAVNQARLSLRKDLIYRRWGAMHGGVYVPVTQKTPPNPYLQHIPERDIRTPSGRQLTLMNPAYMSRQVFELGKEEYGAQGHITSLDPLRPENIPDSWERAVMGKFHQDGMSELYAEEPLGGESYMRYMKPMITEQGCLKCHAHQGYKLGDIRGGISVSVPLAPFTEQGNKQRRAIAFGHSIIWLVGIGFLGLVRRRLTSGLERELETTRQMEAVQSQLFQQEKMASVGQLAAGVAHEINNPMGFITSNLGSLDKYVNRLSEYIGVVDQAMQGCCAGDQSAPVLEARKRLKIDRILDDAHQLITESQDGAGRVRRIVQDLKSFSRVDQAETALIDPNEALETTINIAWNEIKYVAEMKREFGEIPKVNCFPQQLNQVFLNLLVNAAHALGETHGEITVRTEQEGDQVLVKVSDTGCGMPPEVQRRIFEPFFTTKEVGKGTGLGHSISYDIIKKHGGEITVESEVGQGTTFTVRLPLESESSKS